MADPPAGPHAIIRVAADDDPQPPRVLRPPFALSRLPIVLHRRWPGAEHHSGREDRQCSDAHAGMCSDLVVAARARSTVGRDLDDRAVRALTGLSVPNEYDSRAVGIAT